MTRDFGGLLLAAFLALQPGPAAGQNGSSVDIFAPPIRDVPERSSVITDVAVAASVDTRARMLRVRFEAGLRAARPDVRRIAFPLYRLAVDSVTAQAPGVDSLVVEIRPDSVVVALSSSLSRTARSVVQIYYTVSAGTGIELSTDPRESGSCCLWTASRWLPVAEDPGVRFDAELVVEAPPEWNVVAPGRSFRSDGRWTFRTARAVADGELVFAAGTFSSERRGRRVWHLPSTADGDLDLLDTHIQDAQDYLGNVTGFRLPWDTLRVVLLPLGGLPEAREATGPGYLALSESRLSQASSGRAATHRYEIAERVARQWTHHAIVPDWWTEVWIHNGLSGAIALSFLEEREGQEESAGLRLHLLDRYLAEARTYVRPLVWDRWHKPEDLDDEHANSKGTLIVHAIRESVGRPSFQTAVRRLFARWAFRPTNSDALLQLVDPDGRGPATRLFESLVWGAGHPVIGFSSEFDPASETLSATIKQTQGGTLVPEVVTFDSRIEWLTLAGLETAPVSVRERVSTWDTQVTIAPRFATLDPDGIVPAEVVNGSDLASTAARLRYGSVYDRQRAARELVRWPTDPSLRLAMRLAFQQEESPWVRSLLMQAAGSLPPSPSSREVLFGGLADEDPRVRRSALEALAQMDPDGASDGRIRAHAWSETIHPVQAAAVRAMSGPGAVDLARSALITPAEDEVVLSAGVDVLAASGESTRAEFLTHTEPSGRPPAIRVALGLASGAGSDRQTRLRILALLDHPDTSVRMAAVQAGHLVLRPGNAPAVRRLANAEWHATVREVMENLAASLQGSDR